MKVSTENDNNFGYEKITILVDNIPLSKQKIKIFFKKHDNLDKPINNTWFLGKSESVNACKKADFDGFREKDE
jgi:hypothetical protein